MSPFPLSLRGTLPEALAASPTPSSAAAAIVRTADAAPLSVSQILLALAAVGAVLSFLGVAFVRARRGRPDRLSSERRRLTKTEEGELEEEGVVEEEEEGELEEEDSAPMNPTETAAESVASA